MDEERLILVPRGNPGLAPLQLNVGGINAAEARISEIAYVNAYKAPELLAVFNRAYLDVMRMLAWLEMEAGTAARQVKLRRSELLLDIAPQKLKDKGLSTSQDLREAVVDADARYQELCEREGCINATQELLKGRAKSLEMAYTSVKKILGDSGRGSPGYTAPTHTPADREADTQPGENVDHSKFFGNAR